MHRCKRLGIECHYLKQTAPPDLDYVELVNSKELEQDIQQLNVLMANLESEMQQLKTSSSAPIIVPSDGPLYETVFSDSDDEEDSVFESNSSSSTSSTPASSSEDSQRMVATEAQPDQLEEKSKWQLTVTRNGFHIDTNIKSYKELLQQLRSLHRNPALLSEEYLPMLKKPKSLESAVVRRYHLSTGLRRAYFRAVAQCIKFSNQQESDTGHYGFQENSARTHRILDAYFSCQFFNGITFHRSTFYRLSVDENNPDSSPAVCALAAAALTQRCYHVRGFLSDEEAEYLHVYYYERARQLVATRFDDISIEIFATYVSMARYNANLQRPDQAEKYWDYALRMRHLLLDDYIPAERSRKDPSERELFKRLHMGLYFVGRFVDFTRNRRGVPQDPKHKKRSPARCLIKELVKVVSKSQCMPTALPDEPPKTIRAINKDIYAARLNSCIHNYRGFTRFSDYDSLPLAMMTSAQESLDACYYKSIPDDYRLSSEIFDKGVSDEEFQKRLRSDEHLCHETIALAITYYQIIITIHEPFLQPLPPHISGANQPELGEYFLDENVDNERSVFSIRAQEICFHAALVLVRLFEYYVSNPKIRCGFHSIMPCLTTAWDVHLRNACLGLKDLDRPNDYVPTEIIKVSRDCLLRCLRIVQNGYSYNAVEQPMWYHFQKLENIFMQAMFSIQSSTSHGLET